MDDHSTLRVQNHSCGCRKQSWKRIWLHWCAFVEIAVIYLGVHGTDVQRAQDIAKFQRVPAAHAISAAGRNVH